MGNCKSHNLVINGEGHPNLSVSANPQDKLVVAFQEVLPIVEVNSNIGQVELRGVTPSRQLSEERPSMSLTSGAILEGLERGRKCGCAREVIRGEVLVCKVVGKIISCSEEVDTSKRTKVFPGSKA
jgi:hypothetical protein